MTVSTQVRRTTLAWTGVETSFAVGFPVDKPADLRVVFRKDGVETDLSPGIHYSVTLNASTKLATVTPIALPPPATGEVEATLTMVRTTPALVTEQLQDGEDFPASVHQALHDRAAMRSAEHRDDLSRALLLTVSSVGDDAEYDVEGRRIRNHPDPIVDSDLATAGWVKERTDGAVEIATTAATAATSAASTAVAAGNQAVAARDEAVGTLASKAPLASPLFTGNPRVPTADVSVKALTAASTDWVKKVIGFLNADWYRQTGDVDDTACIQRALATGLSVRITDIGRNWIVSGDLMLTTYGQHLRSDGRQKVFLVVGTTAGFTNGVVVLAAPYTEVRGVGIQFIQPDTTNPAALTIYKPAFYFAAAVHSTLRQCGVYAATDAVKLAGNCGGAIIDDLHGSYFRYGLDGDGCLHTVAVRNMQGWLYNMVPNLVSILTGENAPQTHLRIGRIDDLKITDSLFIGGKGAHFRNVDNINCTCEMLNVAFDSINYGMQVEGGTVTMTGGNMSPGPAANVKFVLQTDGILSWRPAWIYPVCASDEPNTPWLDIQGGRFSLVGCGDIDMDSDGTGLSQDKPLLFVSGASTDVTFSDNKVRRQAGKVLTNPLVKATEGRLTAIGNTATDSSTGATFIAAVVDEWHRIKDNRAPGWTYAYPATRANGIYAGNLPSDPIQGGLIDTSATLDTLAQGATRALPNGNGLLVVSDEDNGRQGLFLVGGGDAKLIGFLSPANGPEQYIVSSTPTSGYIGLYFDSSTGRFRLKNNKGSTARLSIGPLYPRSSN